MWVQVKRLLCTMSVYTRETLLPLCDRSELGSYPVAVWGTMVVQHFQLLNIYIIKVMSKHPD